MPDRITHTLRLGVLGAGRMGRVHAEHLARRIEGVQVVVWADPTEPDLAGLARGLGIERIADHWRQVVDSDDLDAVVIATPTDTHHEIVMAASRRGLAIFCEKPLDLRLPTLREIQAEVERRHVTLMVAFQRRFDPAFAALQREIGAGRIGRPHTLRIVSRDSRLPSEAFIPRSGGIFMDMTVHDFDMSRFLLNLEIEEVFARASRLVDPLVGPMFERHGDWDTTLVSVRFAGGVLGVIENGRLASYGYDQRIEVFGSAGMLSVENPPHALASGVSGDVVPFFAERYAEAYRIELQAFVDALRTGAPPPVGVVESIRAVEASLAATRSVAERRPVAIDEIRSSSNF
jgi:myo-inositol 2-dehydrogenase / D-chiro-inositol 1-dehydrogenase